MGALLKQSPTEQVRSSHGDETRYRVCQVLQCAAVCRIMLQCLAVCGSAWQHAGFVYKSCVRLDFVYMFDITAEFEEEGNSS